MMPKDLEHVLWVTDRLDLKPSFDYDPLDKLGAGKSALPC